jgi:sRNA-binding regulator protein Hfq
MNKQDIQYFLNSSRQEDVRVQVDFFDGSFALGFFHDFDDSEVLAKENKWSFISDLYANSFMQTTSINNRKVYDGESIKRITEV